MRRVLLPRVRAGREDHPVLADDLGEPRAEVEADAVLAVQLGEEVAQLGAEHAVQRCRLGFDDGHLRAVLAGRGRHLQADPAGARDDEVAVVAAQGGEDPLEALGVGEAAQMVHAREVGARDVQAAGLGAGRDQQLVVVDEGAVVAEADGLGRTVDRVDGLAEVQLDVVARVPGRFVDEDAVALLLAEQIALGERRALVGVVPFVADQYHAAGETLRSERLGRLRAGETATDDDECLIRVDHLLPPARGSGDGPQMNLADVAICERPARSVMREEGVTRSGHRGSHPGDFTSRRTVTRGLRCRTRRDHHRRDRFHVTGSRKWPRLHGTCGVKSAKPNTSCKETLLVIPAAR